MLTQRLRDIALLRSGWRARKGFLEADPGRDETSEVCRVLRQKRRKHGAQTQTGRSVCFGLVNTWIGCLNRQPSRKAPRSKRSQRGLVESCQ